MFALNKAYISACLYAVRNVILQPIFIFIAPYNCEQLAQCFSEVERVKAKFEKLLLLKKEKEGEEQDF